MGEDPKLKDFEPAECDDEMRTGAEAAWEPDSETEKAVSTTTRAMKDSSCQRDNCSNSAAEGKLDAADTASPAPPNLDAPHNLDTAPWLDLEGIMPKQEIVLALLQATCAICASIGAPCWLNGATLLGSLRHSGFVPHDDDADIECLESDAPKLEAAVAGHPRLIYRLGGWWRGSRKRIAHVGFKDGVELDIFLREDELEELPDFPSKAEIFPLRSYNFHGLELPGPADPNPVLVRLFGSDCLTTARVWTHCFNFTGGLGHDPGRVAVTLAEYNALVERAGYRPPSTPAADSEVALERLFDAGGAVQRSTKRDKETEFDCVRRRNAEQAEARAKLLEAQRAQRADASCSAEDGA